jgi:ABC-type lipoprotein release transport system permease subunit
MGPMVRQVAREIAPEASVDVSPLADRVGASFEQPRMRAAALGVSAVVTLLLAAIGLYAVLAFNVSLREREWGIRSALGASPTRLLRTVVGEGLACVGLGLVIGLMAAACLTGAVRGLLFGMDPTDPVSFALAPVLLLPVALAACLLPALRASRANAVELLRRV